GLSTLQIQGGRAECLIDIAIGVEDVLQDAIHAANAEAVELRANLGALAGDLMTDATVFLEDRGARRRIGLCLEKERSPPNELLLQLLIGRGQAPGQAGHPSLPVRDLRAFELDLDGPFQQQASRGFAHGYSLQQLLSAWRAAGETDRNLRLQ